MEESSQSIKPERLHELQVIQTCVEEQPACLKLDLDSPAASKGSLSPEIDELQEEPHGEMLGRESSIQESEERNQPDEDGEIEVKDEIVIRSELSSPYDTEIPNKSTSDENLVKDEIPPEIP